MLRLTLNAAMLLCALVTPAFAEGQSWNVTEVTESVGGPEGQWHLTANGDKISGSAKMQTGKGEDFVYKLDGVMKGSEFTITMSDRTDGKKGCVATGQSTLNDDQKSHRVIAKVHCDGDVKFYVRGGY